MNPELKKTVIEMIEIEAMELIENYNWEWDDHMECMVNENNEDVADCVYYDCDGYLIHPKVLATYVEDYLRFGKDKKMIWDYDLK